MSLTSDQHVSHMEMVHSFKVSSEKKNGEAGDRSCNPWIGSPVCCPLYYVSPAIVILTVSR